MKKLNHFHQIIFFNCYKNSNTKIRNDIRIFLEEKGVQTSVHYPAVHRFSIYSDYQTNLPVTNYVTDNIITLPMYSSLLNSEVDYICDQLSKALAIYHPDK